MIETLIVLAKEPIAGRVKTRLVPPFSHGQAAALAAAALRDTLRTAAYVDAEKRVLVFCGDARGWAPDGWQVVPQVDGELDLRLAAAFTHAGSGPTVLIGMDTPQFRADQLPAFDDGYQACLGMAADGGFWAIGFADPGMAAAAVPGVRMSTSRTGADQLTRMRGCGLTVQLLDALVDVDTAAAAKVVADRAPDGEFARCLHRIPPGSHGAGAVSEPTDQGAEDGSLGPRGGRNTC
jgi:glycosyltransferase A (GT-A) superfamily protein (DUF2064 family)